MGHRIDEPHSIEAEEGFLGSIIIDSYQILRVVGLVRAADFFLGTHAAIYAAMLDLHEKGSVIDLLTLSDHLEASKNLKYIGGLAYLNQLMTDTPNHLHVEDYANLIRKYATLRRLIAGAGRLARLAHQKDDPDSAIAQARNMLIELVEQSAPLTARTRPLNLIVNQYYERALATKMQGQRMGLSTGMPGLDEICGRLQKGDLILAAGRSGAYLSALALKIARAVAAAKRHVVYFSPQMSDEQLVQNMIASETGIPERRLLLGDMNDEEWQSLGLAKAFLTQTAMFIDDTPSISIYELRARARWVNRLYGLDLIVADYVQLMLSGQKMNDRPAELSYIGRGLKALARELNVPVLVLSRLATWDFEIRPDKRPLMTDLEDLGHTFEIDTDMIWFVHLDELTGLLEVIQAKWKFGSPGIHKLYVRHDGLDFSDNQF